jgi:hypothetical protein
MFYIRMLWGKVVLQLLPNFLMCSSRRKNAYYSRYFPYDKQRKPGA